MEKTGEAMRARLLQELHTTERFLSAMPMFIGDCGSSYGLFAVLTAVVKQIPAATLIPLWPDDWADDTDDEGEE